MGTKLLVAAAAISLLTTAPVGAHHSFAAEFDASKPFKLSGVVTKVEWQNPHTIFYLDITDDQTKKVTNWSFEMGSPNGLMRNGWTRNTLKLGDVVTVKGSQAKDGSFKGNASSVVLSTGQRLFAGSSQPGAEGGADQ
jgi:hypothetical protein